MSPCENTFFLVDCEVFEGRIMSDEVLSKDVK